MYGIRRTIVALIAGLALANAVGAEGPVPVAPRLSPMPFETARDRTLAWAATLKEAPKPPDDVLTIWGDVESRLTARDVHELVVRSVAAVEPATAKLLASFDPRNPPVVPPDLEGLIDSAADDFQRTNVALHIARLLTDSRMYDEALVLFEEADLKEAVDPATALFYRAVCEHQLLMKQEGLKTLASLDAAQDVPESYSSVARLMRKELEALEPESLDEIAGLMRDVERRLELARGGQRVQKKEDEIAAKLDEMIKKIERQMSQSSGSGGSGNGGGAQPNNPLGESVVKGSTAPGEVDPKDVRREGGWGDLPPREREQAKNEIEKAFPANYGRLINEYFLKRTRVERPEAE